MGVKRKLPVSMIGIIAGMSSALTMGAGLLLGEQIAVFLPLVGLVILWKAGM